MIIFVFLLACVALELVDGVFALTHVTPRLLSVAFGDLDGDVDEDLVVSTGLALWWLENDGAGAFGEPRRVSTKVRAGGHTTFVIDANADGAADVCTTSSQELMCFAGFNGTFSDVPLNVSHSRPTQAWWDLRAAWTADIDADGVADVLLHFDNDAAVIIYGPIVNDGAYVETLTSVTNMYGAHPSFADVDGDGKLDLFISRSTYVLVCMNDGSGRGISDSSCFSTGAFTGTSYIRSLQVAKLLAPADPSWYAVECRTVPTPSPPAASFAAIAVASNGSIDAVNDRVALHASTATTQWSLLQVRDFDGDNDSDVLLCRSSACMLLENTNNAAPFTALPERSIIWYYFGWPAVPFALSNRANATALNDTSSPAMAFIAGTDSEELRVIGSVMDFMSGSDGSKVIQATYWPPVPKDAETAATLIDANSMVYVAYSRMATELYFGLYDVRSKIFSELKVCDNVTMSGGGPIYGMTQTQLQKLDIDLNGKDDLVFLSFGITCVLFDLTVCECFELNGLLISYGPRVLADVDGDGDYDLVVHFDEPSSTIEWCENTRLTGSALFLAPKSFGISTGPADSGTLELIDVDGDNIDDVVLAYHASVSDIEWATVSGLLARSTSLLVSAGELAGTACVSSRGRRLVQADVDRDGLGDIICFSTESPPHPDSLIAFLRRLGPSNSFDAPVTVVGQADLLGAPEGVMSIQVLDHDQDGSNSIFCSMLNYPVIFEIEWKAPGFLAPVQFLGEFELWTGLGPPGDSWLLSTGYIDEDGQKDMVAIGGMPGQITVPLFYLSDPTWTPTVAPTPSPTSPTSSPTKSPTKHPTPDPTRSPTRSPTKYPTPFPTPFPTLFPTPFPSPFPTLFPTPFPSPFPTLFPTSFPTHFPTPFPSAATPTKAPTRSPTRAPSPPPTRAPSTSPSAAPTPTPTPTLCGNNVTDAAIGEQCDGGACCTANCALRVGTVCRAATGACDKVEVCDGVDALCPSDAREPPGTVCRAAAGVCDVDEACDGASKACPAYSFAAAAVVCRAVAPGDACDVEERCTGASAACPADALAGAATVCRAAAGACDVEERCTGAAKACPSDARVPAGTDCRAAAAASNPCDAAEQCEGAGGSAACPPDVNRTQGAACDDADACTAPDECTASGVCTGAYTCECAADAECDDANPCSLHRCLGGACVYTAAGAAGGVCRPAAGACDEPEQCVAGQLACPDDAYKPAETVCRQLAGACDVVERCRGASAFCADDARASAATLCRAALAHLPCGAAEYCTGVDVACPAGTVRDATHVCRAAVGACDVAERCDGASYLCAADARAPIGASCDDGASCTVADECTRRGVCRGVYACVCASDVECNDFDECTVDVCAGTRCESVGAAAFDGAVCEDGDACTLGDACDAAGACVAGAATTDECAARCNAAGGDCCGGACVCRTPAWIGRWCDIEVVWQPPPYAWCVNRTETNSSSGGGGDCRVWPFYGARAPTDAVAGGYTLDGVSAALGVVNGLGRLRASFGRYGVAADAAAAARADDHTLLDGDTARGVAEAVVVWFAASVRVRGVRLLWPPAATAGTAFVRFYGAPPRVLRNADGRPYDFLRAYYTASTAAASSKKRAASGDAPPPPLDTDVVIAAPDAAWLVAAHTVSAAAATPPLLDLAAAPVDAVAVLVEWASGGGFSLTELVIDAPTFNDSLLATAVADDGGGGAAQATEAGVDAGVVAVASIGGVACVLVVAALAVVVVRRRRRRRRPLPPPPSSSSSSSDEETQQQRRAPISAPVYASAAPAITVSPAPTAVGGVTRKKTANTLQLFSVIWRARDVIERERAHAIGFCTIDAATGARTPLGDNDDVVEAAMRGERVHVERRDGSVEPFDVLRKAQAAPTTPPTTSTAVGARADDAIYGETSLYSKPDDVPHAESSSEAGYFQTELYAKPDDAIAAVTLLDDNDEPTAHYMAPPLRARGGGGGGLNDPGDRRSRQLRMASPPKLAAATFGANELQRAMSRRDATAVVVANEAMLDAVLARVHRAYGDEALLCLRADDGALIVADDARAALASAFSGVIDMPLVRAADGSVHALDSLDAPKSRSSHRSSLELAASASPRRRRAAVKSPPRSPRSPRARRSRRQSMRAAMPAESLHDFMSAAQFLAAPSAPPSAPTSTPTPPQSPRALASPRVRRREARRSRRRTLEIKN